MKKFTSLFLAILMAFSVLTIGALSVSAAEEDSTIALTAGSKIFFDASNTEWDEVYFYAWNYGYFGDSVPMTKVSEDSDVYSIVVPVDVPAYDEDGNATEYFLFKNVADWSGEQTANQTVVAGKNTYTPVYDEEGNMTVKKSNTEYTAETEVAITPYSKDFTGSIDVTVYAFNTTTATYQVSGSEAVTFTESTTITLTDTATVTVTAGDKTTSCTFTKIKDAVITVYATDADGETPYTGAMYIYTYGGDRVAPGFEPMTNEGEGKYTYTLNGSAYVIFTTTNNWSTAVKFIIDGDEQEPFVASGSTMEFDVSLS